MRTGGDGVNSAVIGDAPIACSAEDVPFITALSRPWEFPTRIAEPWGLATFAGIGGLQPESPKAIRYGERSECRNLALGHILGHGVFVTVHGLQRLARPSPVATV